MIMGEIIFSAIAGVFAGAGSGVGIVLIKKALTRSKPLEKEQYKTTFAFSGNLKQTPLIDAIQFLEIGRREGILHIYCGRRKGYLIFKDGQVADAFYRNFTGKEASFAMLDLDEGDFYFEAKTITQPRLITESVMDLAFEWDSRKNSELK
jgi:hypothetical protein